VLSSNFIPTLGRQLLPLTDNDEYDVRIGIEWSGGQPLAVLTTDTQGFTYDGVSTPLHRYTPVETTVKALSS
jgi:hypothetical protein